MEQVVPGTHWQLRTGSGLVVVTKVKNNRVFYTKPPHEYEAHVLDFLQGYIPVAEIFNDPNKHFA